MAHADDDRDHWDENDKLYSSSDRDSDESPILSYRYDKYRKYAPYVREIKPEEKEKRTFTVLAKFFFFCTAMILFFVLMYIPVYNRANNQLPRSIVAGWSAYTNRDTRIYVQPNNETTIHEPTDVCPKKSRHKKNNLFLLIIVCSSTVNFDRRLAIRETWGNYKNYLEMSEIFKKYREKYNLTFNSHLNNVANKTVRREIASFGQLMPILAKALKQNVVSLKLEDAVTEEKRFDDDVDKMLPQFDMNKEIGDQELEDEGNYDYDTNVMKIPPKGYEDESNLNKVLNELKKSEILNDMADYFTSGDTEPDFKVVFLLGLPPKNDTDVKNRIEDEVAKYGDVIQERFIDSYNNLTLKSIMMLKWITSKCNESVRYILKTDDDMYINVPNLMMNLRNRSKEYDAKVAKGFKEKEYLLIGDLIRGARPVLDPKNKWYSPRYMYAGRVYPRYLSGTGYALSAPTARALYAAALTTHLFHLEDIYITGMCAMRSNPRVTPRDDPGFTYQLGGDHTDCLALTHLTAHRVPPAAMRDLHARLRAPSYMERCEKIRLAQIRRDSMRPKKPPKSPKIPAKTGLLVVK